MKKIKINLNNTTREEINLVVGYLRRGKVIVCPTDTIYGIGCIATDKGAIDRVYKIKKRNRKEPLLILVGSLAMAKKHCYMNKSQEEYLRKVWTGAPKLKSDFGRPKSDFNGRSVSVILKSRGLLPKNLTGGADSIAVRLPRNEILSKIIRQIGVPIVSTSVNISGKKNLTNISKIDKYFSKNKPDLVVNIGELSSKPSKIVDLRDISNIKILRK